MDAIGAGDDGCVDIPNTNVRNEVSPSSEQRGRKRRLDDEPIERGRDTVVARIDNTIDSEASMPEQTSEAVKPSVEDNGNSSSPEGIAEGSNTNVGSDTAATPLENPKEGIDASADHVEGSSLDLPEGMVLEWNSNRTRAVLTIKSSDAVVGSTDRELRVCLVGRARISVVEGSAEVLGHRMEASGRDKDDETDSDDDSSKASRGVLVTSPYWSSWMTIEADPLSLPCRMILECVRGPETFTVTAPKRPILLPPSWRDCAESIVRYFGPQASDLDPSQRLRRRIAMADSLEDCRASDGVRRVCMITGAKGVGKSTLLRYLTNRMLSARKDDDAGGVEEVAILDTDVGQPELAPPGLLRLSIVRKPLLQPPYWNLVPGETVVKDDDGEDGCSVVNPNDKPQGPCYGPQLEHPGPAERDSEIDNEKEEDEIDGVEVVSSVFFGASTSKVDPTRYIEGVQFLMGKYESEVADSGEHPIPLLINMDGWVKGVGYEILTALIESLGPTHLVQILGDIPGQTFDLPPSVLGVAAEDADPALSTNAELESSTQPPKLYRLEACQTLPGASLCRIPAFTTRHFRWATYFLPHQLQTFDAWDFVSAKDLQTGWIAATNSDQTTSVPQWWHTTTIGAVDGDQNTIGHTTNEIGAEENDEKSDNELDDECRLAKALARERPYCVPMEAVEAFVIGSDFEDYLRVPISESDTAVMNQMYERIFRALNGCVLSLCTDTSTMESLGYGILRSIDWEKRLLYVLVAPEIVAGRSNDSLSRLLSTVKALVGGSLPLPLAMLYRGVYAESFPYLTTPTMPASQNSVILGSEPMKSRNNIGRRGLANAERNAK